MIYTVTFNPALDYIVRTDGLEIGKTNRSASEEIYIGGKGINVSTVLGNLGIKSTLLGFLAGFTGYAIENEINKMGLISDFVHLKKGLTRINVKLKTPTETEINAAGPDIPQTAIDELFSKLKNLKSGDIIVLAGSIPKTLPSNIYEKILSALYGKGIKFIVDATGELLTNVLEYQPFLIKPNVDELSEIVGENLDTPEKIVNGAKKLRAKGAVNVLVSMGGDGAMLLDERGEVTFMPILKKGAINTVGAGDSMVAGFLAGYLDTGDYKYALKLGSAAGSATACSPWLATKKDIDEIMRSVK